MDHSVRARKRVALYGALATIVLFFAFPVMQWRRRHWTA